MPSSEARRVVRLFTPAKNWETLLARAELPALACQASRALVKDGSHIEPPGGSTAKHGMVQLKKPDAAIRGE